MALLCFLVLLELDVSLSDADWSLLLEPAALVSFELDFCPERVSAGVLVALSLARPEALMCEVALSRPVDFEALLPLVPLVEALSEDELGALEEEEPLMPLEEPVELLLVPEVEPDVPLEAFESLL